MPEKEVFLVVAYDIVSDRRRNRLFKVLKGYGVRANYSVLNAGCAKEQSLISKTKYAQSLTKRRIPYFFTNFVGPVW